MIKKKQCINFKSLINLISKLLFKISNNIMQTKRNHLDR